MRSKFTLVLQFGVMLGILVTAQNLLAQRYHPGPGQQPGGAGAFDAVGQSDNPFLRRSTPAPSAGAPAASGSRLSAKDKHFLTEAAASGSWEIATGKSAEQKAQSSGTKEIASRMIADHSKTNKELIDLGNKKGLTISSEGSKPQQISSEDFDKRYLNLVVQDHQQASDLFAKEAASGDDPDIKKWAAKTLPTIKQHLAQAKGALNKAK